MPIFLSLGALVNNSVNNGAWEQGRINHSGAPYQRKAGLLTYPPLPSLPFLSPPYFLSPLVSLEVAPLNPT